ncbi:flavin reductase [Aminobacter anthyllidis]|uniref:Flavin reductase n=1 Tax=Aminobacter anthyllidis TaxID=1035067 RepID=A0A9X1D772_9HYPH|nr:LysR substrate-binding domain-containing protein [Aminobacter anthyllidis]MBT1159660.1 flavin reductase [Aminobacter anthyllidis]
MNNGLAQTVSSQLRERFLVGMSSAACTVNVVTTDGPAGRFGLTVSAMSSVTADTPQPTLLVCVNQSSASAQAIVDNGVFCVNVLRDDQSFISDCFSGRFKTPDGSKFSCTNWVADVTGSPRVVDPLVAFSCRVASWQIIGTHYVLMGSVEDIFSSKSGSPLIYANRAYGTPARIDTEQSQVSSANALKLGAFHTFGPYFVPQVLANMSSGGASIDLKLLEGDQRRVLEGLKAGTVDVALINDVNLGADVSVERLTAHQPYVLLAEGHPLTAHQSLSLDQLAKWPLILLDAPPSGEYFTDLFRTRGLDPKIRFKSTSFEMVRGLVAQGLGYGFLVTKPASNMSYDGRSLTTRPLQDAIAGSHLALVTRRNEMLEETPAAFVDACRRLFQEA